MKDELIRHYNEELSYLRKSGSEFANANPNIANQLKLSEHNVEDPMVNRLIQSFAFLTARIHHKLDDEHADISTALLSLLYPHFLLPCPSMTIVKLSGQEGLQSRHTIPINTALLTTTHDEKKCHFKTCYPVDLLPIRVASIQYKSTPPSSHNKHTNPAKSYLSIQLNSNDANVNFKTVFSKPLRLYINMDLNHARVLYRLLTQSFCQIQIANSAQENELFDIEGAHINPVGFNHKETLLPRPEQSHACYQILTEYFVYPEKFMFFDVVLPDSKILNNINDSLIINFYFSDYNRALEHLIDPSSLQTSCTPVINLYEIDGDPISINHHTSEYRVVKDRHESTDNTEIYSINHVAQSRNIKTKISLQPLFSLQHEQAQHPIIYWQVGRKVSWKAAHTDINGYEHYLRFISADNNETLLEDSWLASPQLTCFDRDLPSQLPYSSFEPSWNLWNHADDNIASIQSLKPMSVVIRPTIHSKTSWQLTSLLSLNYLSIASDSTSCHALKELLQLHNHTKSSDNECLIHSIERVSTKTITRRHPQDKRLGFCRGIEITLRINEQQATLNDFYPFACVLNEFFTLYCTINSFTELVVTNLNAGELARWAPRIGQEHTL